MSAYLVRGVGARQEFGHVAKGRVHARWCITEATRFASWEHAVRALAGVRSEGWRIKRMAEKARVVA